MRLRNKSRLLREQKLRSRIKNYKNLGNKITKIWGKNLGTKISKIQEQKLKKSGNKNYKNPRTKKSDYKNSGTKLHKSGNKNYKNS
jgi:hypothetical protein